MTSDTAEATIFARYLTGDLSQSEIQSLEARILEDDELFEHCMAVETELVDAWIRGELGHDELPGLMQLLGSSTRLQRTFQTTLALDVNHSGNVASAAADEPIAEQSASKNRRRPLSHSPVGSSRVAAGLIGAAMGFAVAAIVVWLYMGNQQQSQESVLAEAQLAREQLGAALTQERATNKILERELAQAEAAKRARPESLP